MNYFKSLILLASVTAGGCSTTYYVSPVASPDQEVRYAQGTPTTFSAKDHGAVQVTPIGLNDDMRLVFGVAAFNASGAPANLGVENLALQNPGGKGIRIFTASELVAEAKRKAQWNEALVAIATLGLVAASAQPTTTNGYVSSRYGTTTFHATTYNPSAAVAGAVAAGQAGAYDIAQIEQSLDATISTVRDRVLQTTTIDPGTSYGGVAVSDDIESDFPQNVMLTVNWNGDVHTFNYMVTKNDQPRPAIVAATNATASASFRTRPPRETLAPGAAPTGVYAPNLGITGSTVKRSTTAGLYMNDPHGVFVSELVPGSVAQQAGVRTGDVITELDGKRVVGIDDFSDMVRAERPGSTIDIQILRDSKALDLTAHL